MADNEAQEDEILALTSIFEDQFSSATECRGGELRICVEVPEDFYVLHDCSKAPVQKYPLHHLPPVVLNFQFPANYPSKESPNYSISCKWLTHPQLSVICQKLDELWKENQGSEIMFTWSQFIKVETLSLFNLMEFLNLTKIFSSNIKNDNEASQCNSNEASDNSAFSIPKLDPRAIHDVGPHTNIFRILREYDEEKRLNDFGLKIFECKVCFLEKSGLNSIQFWPCSHVYCKLCMRNYFEIQIKEGNIKHLLCPEDKCESEANPKQVEELVSEDLYKKWEEMLLSSTLSSIEEIQLCPRKHCQYPVTVEENQGQCPACNFVFCGICRFGWHGMERCRFQTGDAKDLMEKYKNGSEEMKKNLERLYGKKYLVSLLNEYLSFNYIHENAKTCPKCKCNIEKIDGCNKMTCNRCSINFCWICERILDRGNPYFHFNDPKSQCFNLLFHGEELEEDFEDFENFLE